MDDFVMPLPLPLDVVSLTMGLVNIESVSGGEKSIADSVEQALGTQPHLEVERFGNTVVAHTAFGHAERVLLVGHLDTVPGGGGEVLAYVEMGKLFGLGACDMKGGLAVMLKSASLPAYGRDVTFVFYDGEESAESGGLDGIAQTRPDLLRADLAVVLEPTGAIAEVSSDGALVAAFVEPVEEPSVTATGRATAESLVALSVPTVTYGPGDPALAHTPDEFVPTAQLTACEHVLRVLLRD